MHGSTAASPDVPSVKSDFSLSTSSHIALLLLALLLTALTYMATLRFNFVYDDLPQIVNNPSVHSWSFAPGYFTHDVWGHLYPGAPGNYYRPLFMLWLLANFSLFGLNPVGWHLTTVLAHLGVTIMVYWLARRLTGDAVTSAVAALLFGVHPTHIEAVAWISGVTEPLLALLVVPSFVFYLNSREQPSRRQQWLGLSLLFYALSLLSKETAIVLPVLVLAYEWLYPGADTRAVFNARLRRLVLVALPYAAISLVYVLVRHTVLKGLMFPEATLGVRGLLLTWPSLIWLYFKHLLLPIGLSVFYDTPYIFHPTISNFVLPLLACGAIAAALIAWSRKSKTAAMASLWLMLPLVPPLAGIGLFSYNDLAHDRYLYLPSIGFVILLAMLLRRIPSKDQTAGHEVLGLPRQQFVLILALAAALAAGTASQSIRWANNLLLYHYGVQTAPHSALAHIHLGSEMMARDDMPTALRLYREARDLSPDEWAANFVLGFANFQAGRYAEAEQSLRDAIRLSPRNANQYLYLGLTLMHLNRLDEAEATVRHGIASLTQPIGGFHYALGTILQKEGHLAAARDEYIAELKTDPNSGARINLAEVERELASQPR